VVTVNVDDGLYTTSLPRLKTKSGERAFSYSGVTITSFSNPWHTSDHTRNNFADS